MAARRETEARYKVLQAECAAAKKAVDAAKARLDEFVNDPLSGVEPESSLANGKDTHFSDVFERYEERMADVSVSEVKRHGWSKAHVSKMQELCGTLGDLKSLWESRGSTWWEDVRGVGEKTARGMERAVQLLIEEKSAQSEKDTGVKLKPGRETRVKLAP